MALARWSVCLSIYLSACPVRLPTQKQKRHRKTKIGVNIFRGRAYFFSFDRILQACWGRWPEETEISKYRSLVTHLQAPPYLWTLWRYKVLVLLSLFLCHSWLMILHKLRWHFASDFGVTEVIVWPYILSIATHNVGRWRCILPMIAWWKAMAFSLYNVSCWITTITSCVCFSNVCVCVCVAKLCCVACGKI